MEWRRRWPHGLGPKHPKHGFFGALPLGQRGRRIFGSTSIGIHLRHMFRIESTTYRNMSETIGYSQLAASSKVFPTRAVICGFPRFFFIPRSVSDVEKNDVNYDISIT